MKNTLIELFSPRVRRHVEVKTDREERDCGRNGPNQTDRDRD